MPRQNNRAHGNPDFRSRKPRRIRPATSHLSIEKGPSIGLERRVARESKAQLDSFIMSIGGKTRNRISYTLLNANAPVCLIEPSTEGEEHSKTRKRALGAAGINLWAANEAIELETLRVFEPNTSFSSSLRRTVYLSLKDKPTDVYKEGFYIMGELACIQRKLQLNDGRLGKMAEHVQAGELPFIALPICERPVNDGPLDVESISYDLLPGTVWLKSIDLQNS